MTGLVIGVGGRESADPGALLELVAKLLAEHGRAAAEVTEIVTLEARAGHPGIALLAVTHDAGIRSFAAAELAAQPVDHPSATVARHSGTPSVAEAAVRIAGALPLAAPTRADDWVVVLGQPELTSEPTIPDSSRDQSCLLVHELGHHGDKEVAPGMLDFAVNVHGTAPPAFLADALREAVADLARYPDPAEATAAVAAAHGVPAESVLLTHGAAEAFQLVAQQPWRRPAVVHPQFTEPEAALRSAGHQPVRILLGAADGFALPGPNTATQLTETRVSTDQDPGLAGADLVVVGNPTNPTSRLHTRDQLEALAAPGRTVFVDEAFLDAVEPVEAPVHSLARLAAVDRRFLVARSLTKTYAIAGLRIGYVIGHPELLARLAARRTPWPVGTLAAVAAQACLSPAGLAHAAAFRAELPARLDHLTRTLTGAGFAVVPGAQGPFVLARHPDATAIRERLRSQGIAVRRADTFPGLDGSWLRFAAREAAVVDRLAAALS